MNGRVLSARESSRLFAANDRTCVAEIVVGVGCMPRPHLLRYLFLRFTALGTGLSRVQARAQAG